MIDGKQLLKDFDGTIARLTHNGTDPALIDDLTAVYEALREARAELTEFQPYQNDLEKRLALYRKAGKDTAKLKAEIEQNKIRITNIENKIAQASDALTALAINIPDRPKEEKNDRP